MKILLLQQEYLHLSRIKMWNYWCNLGIYEMLKSAGAQVDLIYIPHFKVLREQIDFSSYNNIIINDVVHGFSGEGPIINLDLLDMDFLASTKIPICGIAVESIYTYYKGDKLHDFAAKRLDILNKFLPYFSTFLCSHIFDVRFLMSNHSIPSLWLKPVSFSELHVVSYGNDGQLVFNGSLYPERLKFVNTEINLGLSISQLTLPGEDEEFWVPIIKNICDFALNKNALNICLSAYQDNVVAANIKLRKKAELNLIKSLSRHSSVAHLPAFFKGAHPRIIQALQAGVVPFTPIMYGIESLWLKNDVDCIYYDPEIPGDLFDKFSKITANRAANIIMHGRERNSTLREAVSLGFEILNLLDNFE